MRPRRLVPWLTLISAAVVVGLAATYALVYASTIIFPFKDEYDDTMAEFGPVLVAMAGGVLVFLATVYFGGRLIRRRL
jgi:hypothetical protein